MADAIASFAVEFTADMSGMQSGFQGGLSMARLYGGESAGAFSSGFSSKLSSSMEALSGGMNMFQGLRGQFTSVAQGLSEIFGMKASADLEYYRRQLTGLVGDAGKADDVLGKLVETANATAFSNDDIFKLATNLIGSGTKPDAVNNQVNSIVDAAAVTGIRDRAVFKRMVTNFADLRTDPGNEANQTDVRQLTRASPQLTVQAGKVLGLSDEKEITRRINSMAGPALFDLFTKIGENNKGKAAAEGLADPFTAGATLAETLNNAQAATGKLVNGVITPIIGAGIRWVSLFGKLNEAGQGVPGLLLGLGLVGKLYTTHTTRVQRLDLALANLSGQTDKLAIKMATMPGGGGGIGGGVVGGAAGAIAGARAKIAGLGAGALGMANNLYGLGMFANEDTSNIGEMVLKEGRKKAGDKLESAAEKLEKAASKLDASADGYGYGERGRATLSSIEAGYALLGAQRLGIG
jgi:hypothetical protein